MFKNRIIPVMLFILVMLLATIPVFAGVANTLTVSGDCDGININYNMATGDYVNITVTSGGNTLATFTNEPGSGTVSVEFDPSLDDGTKVKVLIEIYGIVLRPDTRKVIFAKRLPRSPEGTFGIIGTMTRTVTIDCEGFSSGSGKYIQMCDDGRTNINLCEPVAIYPIESDDGVGMTIWDARRTGEQGQLVYISAEDMKQLSGMDGVCVMGQSDDNFVTVYWLGNGEILVYAGPDDESKVFAFVYEIFPGTPTVHTFFGGGPIPEFPDCFD